MPVRQGAPKALRLTISFMTTLRERMQKALEARCAGHGCQAELARACGVREPSVADWMSGKTTTLKAEPAIRAARWLGVSAAWLVLGEGPMKPEVEPWDLRIAQALAKLQPEFRRPLEAAILAAAEQTAKMGPPVADSRVEEAFPPVPKPTKRA